MSNTLWPGVIATVAWHSSFVLVSFPQNDMQCPVAHLQGSLSSCKELDHGALHYRESDLMEVTVLFVIDLPRLLVNLRQFNLSSIICYILKVHPTTFILQPCDLGFPFSVLL